MSIFSLIRGWLPVVLLGQLLFASASPAAELAQPAGTPILTITGAITQTNEPGAARFDLAMLEQFGTVKIRTSTPWHQGVVEFEGVRLDRLMDAVGATGTEVVATALNDYSSTLPIADFTRFGVILATKRDGAYMPVRDRGPLFIIYPFDSNPELQGEDYYLRSVWQVRNLEVR
jgi:hypothetical protein